MRLRDHSRDRRIRQVATGILAAVTAFAFAACVAEPSPAEPTEHQPLKVVASIDVYGNIAQQLGGDRVEVTSLIDSPTIDPHSFEADARSQLAISKADIIIENGGGYDEFMDTMLDASGNMRAVLLRAVTLSRHSGDRDNEHVWFDIPSMRNLSDGLVDALIRSDSAGAKEYRANSARFSRVLDALEKRATRVAEQHGGTPVLVTEPLPLYLLDAMGLKNVTPPEFMKAAESTGEVPPAVMLRAYELLESGEVALLVYNEQSGGQAAEALVKAAEELGIPTVGVTETLPKGLDYQQWMTQIIGEIGALLDEATETQEPETQEPVTPQPVTPPTEPAEEGTE